MRKPRIIYFGAKPKPHPKWRPGPTVSKKQGLARQHRADRFSISANAINLGMESARGTLPTGTPGRAAGAENSGKGADGQTDGRTDKKRARDEVFSKKKKLSGKIHPVQGTYLPTPTHGRYLMLRLGAFHVPTRLSVNGIHLKPS